MITYLIYIITYLLLLNIACVFYVTAFFIIIIFLFFCFSNSLIVLDYNHKNNDICTLNRKYKKKYIKSKSL